MIGLAEVLADVSLEDAVDVGLVGDAAYAMVSNKGLYGVVKGFVARRGQISWKDGPNSQIAPTSKVAFG